MSVLERLRSANPVQRTGEFPGGPEQLEHFITDVLARSAIVTHRQELDQETTRLTPKAGEAESSDGRAYRGWLAGAAAAVIVLLAVGAAIWLVRDKGPQVLGADATPDELLTAFSEGVAAGDVEAVVALFTEDALIEGFAPGDSDSYVVGAAEVREFVTTYFIRRSATVTFAGIEAAGDATASFDAFYARTPDRQLEPLEMPGGELRTENGLIAHMLWGPAQFERQGG